LKYVIFLLRVCRYPKFGLDSDIKYLIRIIQKFDIRADGFLTETACSLQFKLKMTKITLLALNLQIKNILKHSKTKFGI